MEAKPPETAIDIYRSILTQLSELNEKVGRLVTLIDGNADLGVMGLRVRMENIEEIGLMVQDMDERVDALEQERIMMIRWLVGAGAGVVIMAVGLLWFILTNCPCQ